MKQLLAAFLAGIISITTIQGQNTIPSADKNYVKTRTYTSDNGTTFIDEIQYYDGLGRPVQTVQSGITPSGSDLVSYQEYDSFGREDKTWLPAVVSGNKGAFVSFSNFKTKSNQTYNGTLYNSAADTNPYSYPVYEANPLNRVKQQFGAGKDWHNNKKAVSYAIQTTRTGFICPKFTSTDTRTSVSVTRSGNYASNDLFVNEITDEDGNISYEFRDKLGLLVATRQMNGTETFHTSYVYDSYGNLRVVLPPLAVDNFTSGTWTESTQLFKDYAYAYKYDSRNRCISKKIPGADWVHFIYDKADRLIFSQDGEQRKKSEWTFSIPDKLGRVALTGVCKNSLSYSSDPLKSVFVYAQRSNATNTYKGHTISGITLSSPTVYTVNYYDNYDFMGYNGIPGKTDANFKYETVTGYGKQYSKNNGYECSGLLTGTLTYIFGLNNYTCSVMYYDYKGQLIQVKETNHMGGTDKEYLAYTFTGNISAKRYVHSISQKSAQTEVYTYSYDHAGRLLESKHKLNSNAEIILAKNTYDELGRLKTTTHNNRSLLQTSYKYNIRSWLSEIRNSNYFIENLTYTYSGNISTQQWQQFEQRSSWSNVKKYTFSYDGLSRMLSAVYSSSLGTDNLQVGYRYDKHGNITRISRSGMTAPGKYGNIDQLLMDYGKTNQLRNVDDISLSVITSNSMDFKDYTKGSGIEYTYNANGAMTKDLNKGISSIEYNSLNLPETVKILSPVAEARKMYLYSAHGEKLRELQNWNPNYSTTPIIGGQIREEHIYKSFITDYIKNKVYENHSLKRILVDNGYYQDGKYYFYIKDHSGSNRVVVNELTALIQSTEYYPFGMSVTSGTGPDSQPYKHEGKELDLMHGLNLYDSSARWYDPVIGRFTSVDPLAEKYYSISPYVYAGNNPMRNIDINGDSITVLNKGDGEHVALLIQNDKGKWQYFSINGNNVYISGKFSGGRKFNDLAVGEFDSPQQFLESSYNSMGDSDDKSINSYEYTEAYTLPTTQEQDNTVRNTFIDISNNEEYRLSPFNPNQCANVVQRSLNSVGIETRTTEVIPSRTITNRSTGGDTYNYSTRLLKGRPYLPSTTFKTIIQNNPQGQYIRKQK